MKISLNWLKDFITLSPRITPEELAWRLTEAVSEVEKIHYRGYNLSDIVVGELVDIKKHPDADKLSIAKVKISATKTIQVIFGQKAPVKIGDKVPTAIAPTKLHGGEVTVGKIRGQMSEGMLCLDSELVEGLPETLTYFSSKTKIGAKVTDILPLQDVVFEIDNHSITHRADLFSHYGFCREFVALGLAKWKKQYPNYDPKKLSGKKELPFKVTFESNEMTSSYHGTIVEGLDTRPSPDYMKYRLAACGIRAINAIVDITNYVMLEAGSPLHAFDRRAIDGPEFKFRLAKKGESMITLDGKKQQLIDGVMIGETNGRIIDLLGIMGGQNSEVQSDTTSVYFHMDLCNPVLIRKAMIGLGHRTDAGTMYEKGLNPELSSLGISRCLELTKEIFPEAKFNYQMFAKDNFSKKTPHVQITQEKLDKHLGLHIPMKKAAEILESLGCQVKTNDKKLTATIPCWRRNNLQIEEDLAEEVARINGYSNVPTLLPVMQMKQVTLSRLKKLRRILQMALTGMGFLEELNYAFLSEQLLNLCGISIDEHIAIIKNPVSEDHKYMRPNQLPYMLLNLSRNLRLEAKNWRTFELGKQYVKTSDSVAEESMATLLMVNPMPELNAYREAKGVLDNLSNDLNLSFELKDEDCAFAFPGRSLEITCRAVQVGRLFQLSPEIQHNFDIPTDVMVIELSLQKLEEVEGQRMKYKPIGKFPSTQLDVSFIVDETRRVADLEKIISAVEPPLLQAVELVDIYKGKQIESGKKSMTFRMTYRSNEKTLEESEVSGILKELVKGLEKEGAVVRK